MDLVRKIILAIEDSPHGFFHGPLMIDGYDEETIDYHQHLIIQAGLAEGPKTSVLRSPSPSAKITELTWLGHEFADSARNESIWNTAKAMVKDTAGSVSLSVLTELLKHLGKLALGLG